ncbi:hypothetical protein QYH69_05855 [Paraburkholderia sp. SARCC-3016]|uniref:hypothetical protein n=1 Tax=Paraburkholderia sp. SARCC-3016 TaxID=3058611 RepID=UPI0028072EF4|nr:hypothetical protein [Paraburkholderia sp. SARCC-3016]MDQ7976767.1 hypothetical protein [Paraburkholderia sp. SARCC-3016]
MTRKIAGNQEAAFAVLVSEGAVIVGKGTNCEGVVVGKGKPGFPGGTVIPPTEVKIVRPPTVNGGK